MLNKTSPSFAWSVELMGHQFDLEELPTWLAGSDYVVSKKEDAWVLQSHHFESLESPDEVRRAAHELIPLINGLGRVLCPEFQPISTGAIIKDRPGGMEIAVSNQSNVVVRSKVKATVVHADGATDPDPNTGMISRFLSIAEREEKVHRVLTFLTDRHLTWNDLYRTLEVIREDVRSTITSAGWASHSEIRRFKHTANSYSVLGKAARHGHMRKKPPSDPMEFEEARQFVCGIVKSWIQAKVGSVKSLEAT